MNTTAIYENRIRDRKELFANIPLNEFGDNDVVFETVNGLVICIGYNRIVFGDHGPYIEFLDENILPDYWHCERSNIGYYDKYYPIDKSSILLYGQRASVKDLPNPPKGPRSFNGNRKEGYADYIVGRYYISPYERHLRIIKDGVCLNEVENILKELL